MENIKRSKKLQSNQTHHSWFPQLPGHGASFVLQPGRVAGDVSIISSQPVRVSEAERHQQSSWVSWWVEWQLLKPQHFGVEIFQFPMKTFGEWKKNAEDFVGDIKALRASHILPGFIQLELGASIASRFSAVVLMLVSNKRSKMLRKCCIRPFSVFVFLVHGRFKRLPCLGIMLDQFAVCRFVTNEVYLGSLLLCCWIPSPTLCQA